MKKRIIYISIFALIIGVIAAIFLSKGNKESELYRLPVFETSDVHGYIANKKDDSYQYIMAYISNKVKKVRGYDNYDKDLALLLDGGDIYQGSILSNLLNGESVSLIYKEMDYDVVTIGNHEFDWELENTVDNDGTMMDATVKFQVKNDIPVVASNLYKDNEKVSWIKDYVILNKKAKSDTGKEIKVKVAVIGFLDDYSNDILSSLFTEKGYSIKHDLTIPNSIAKKLESEGLADVTILLCHEDAEYVATNLGSDSVIDVVLGGHSHRKLNSVAENGIAYMEPENNGANFSYLELVFNKDKNYKKAENKENIDINISSKDELDNNIVEKTDKIIDALTGILDNKIGYIKTSAMRKEYINGSGYLSTTGGNWVSSVYMRAVNADVAFVNRDGVRYDFVLSSDKLYVTVGDIYSNYPFDNRIYKYKITYEELLDVLNYALKDDNKKTINSVMGIDCYYNNKEVQALVKNGVAIYKNGVWNAAYKTQTLTIATNEYVATTDEVFGFSHNPLVEWNNTSKLIENNKIDSASAIDILTKEGQSNNGLLKIDTKPHFIEGTYK